MSTEGEAKPDGGSTNKKSSPVDAASPLLGNAHNPNMADIPERRKVSSTASVSTTDAASNKEAAGFMACL